MANENPAIETAENFNELYDIVKKMGKILGSDGIIYKAGDLIDRINKLREGLKKFQEKGEIKKLEDLTYKAVKKLIETNGELKAMACEITRSEGLRSRAVKLAIDEAIAQEIGCSTKV